MDKQTIRRLRRRRDNYPPGLGEEVRRLRGYRTCNLEQIARWGPGGWTGPVYADVAPRSMAKQHLVGPEHGFQSWQVSGLTQNEALILHDLAPRHGNKIFPVRSRSSVVVASSQPAPQPLPISPPIKSMPANVGCANGQCARQSAPVVNRSGWRPGKILFGR